MTDSAEFYVRDPCGTIFANISMAKNAVQLGDFLMVNMTEADRLIDRLTSQNWENGENKGFRRNPEAKPCNRGKKKHEDDRHEKSDFLLHSFSLFASVQICQLKIDPPRHGRSNHGFSNLSAKRSKRTRTT